MATAGLTETHVLEADGIRTSYLTAGEGPAVVLLHGSGPGIRAAGAWASTIPALTAQGVRVVAPDLLGFGGTDAAPDGRYDLGRWTDHLTSFLDHLRVDRAVFVGHSFGGALGLSLAARRPVLVQRLVLVSSIGIGFTATPGLSTVWGYRPGRAEARALLQTLLADGSGVTEEIVEARYRASLEGGGQAVYEQQFPAPHQRMLEVLATPEADLAALDLPVLIVHGHDDRVVPLSVAQRLQALLGQADLHVLGRCGHVPQMERAGAFNDLVGRFVTAS